MVLLLSRKKLSPLVLRELGLRALVDCLGIVATFFSFIKNFILFFFFWIFI